MSFEQAVIQLEETNAELVKEVVRVRDAAMGLNRMYPTATAGRQAVNDGEYFTVPGDGAYQRLYRRNGTQAQLIAEYPSVAALEQAIADAESDAEARMNAAADRAEVYADNKGYVARERLRQQATLDLDFASGDYSVDGGEKLRTTNAGEVLTVERATPKWVFGPNGKLREVPPDTAAREWSPKTGEPLGVLIEPEATNRVPHSGYSGRPSTREHLVLSDIPDMQGELNGIRALRPSGAVGGVSVTFPNLFSGGVDTLSFYFYPVSGTLRFLLRNAPKGANLGILNFDAQAVPLGVTNGWTISEAAGGWYFASYTMTQSEADSTEAGDAGIVYFGDAGASSDTDIDCHFSHVQLESGSVATSRIPTAGAPVTRAADNFGNVPNVDKLLPSDFTVVVRGVVLQPGGGGGVNLGVYSASSPGFRVGVFNDTNILIVRVGSINYLAGTHSFPLGEELVIAFSLSRDGSLRVRVSGHPQTHNRTLTEEDASELVRLLKRESGTRLFTRGNDGITRGMSYSVYPYAMTEAELEALTAL